MIEKLIKSIDQLIDLHKSLLNVSLKKTACLKANQIEALRDLMTIEQKHGQALDKIEKARLKEAHVLKETLNLNEEPTVSVLIEALSETEANLLEEKTTALAELMLEVKQQEDLNHQLLKQSLQFVQLQMDLLKPSIENVNYGHKKQTNDPESKRSVFDSKA